MKIVYLFLLSIFLTIIAYIILRNSPLGLMFFNIFVNVLTIITILFKDINIPVPPKVSTLS